LTSVDPVKGRKFFLISDVWSLDFTSPSRATAFTHLSRKLDFAWPGGVACGQVTRGGALKAQIMIECAVPEATEATMAHGTTDIRLDLRGEEVLEAIVAKSSLVLG
jgi:small ligand-binding sensory domain FIST